MGQSAGRLYRQVRAAGPSPTDETGPLAAQGWRLVEQDFGGAAGVVILTHYYFEIYWLCALFVYF